MNVFTSDTTTGEMMATNLNRLVKIGFEHAGTWCLASRGLQLRLHAAMAKETNLLYAFAVDGALTYIGKTTQSLQKRMQGYKSPANNGERGGTTNIKNHRNIRAALAASQTVDIFALRFQTSQSHGEFPINLAAGLEDSLINTLLPPWNGRSPAMQVLAHPPLTAAPLPARVANDPPAQVFHTNLPDPVSIPGATMIPSVETLLLFAREHQARTFYTLQRGSPFNLAVIGNVLEITPGSSSNPRHESRESIAALLARLAKTNSYQMSDYQDLSFNASYVLALVKCWQAPEILLSANTGQSGTPPGLARNTHKKIGGHSEHTARQMMADYYRNNRATLPASIREHRELIVKMIMEGMSPEQAFTTAQTKGNGLP